MQIIFLLCSLFFAQRSLAEAPASVPAIPTFSMYQELSATREIPGFGPTANVKFLVELDAHGAAKKTYFLNTARYQYHAVFAQEFLGIASRAEFEALAYTAGPGRRYIAGNIVFYPNLTPKGQSHPGVFLMELYEVDQITPAQLTLAYQALLAGLPPTPDGTEGALYYRPTRAEHEAMVRSGGIPGVQSLLNDEVFAGLSHLVMNEGFAIGYLRYVSREELKQNPDLVFTLGEHTIPVFELMPLDLGVVAATITEEFQTPLSHINIKSKARGTPNLVLPNARLNPIASALIDAQELVALRLRGSSFYIRKATLEETEAIWASHKPRFEGSLRADLSVRSILSTGATGAGRLQFGSSVAVGAKAANYGELNRLLGPNTVKPAFGIPFYFYQQFIEQNQLTIDIAALMQDPKSSLTDAESLAYRAEKLKTLREERYGKGTVNPELVAEILRLAKLKFPGKNFRLRSSTNSEDLRGFNGAGLYYSGSVKVVATDTDADISKKIAKTLKKVWASAWTDRAFEERALYGIPHDQVKVGVLMTEAFPTEIANGVAVTRNIYNQSKRGIYINTQVGEASVTNPEAGEDGTIPISEELLIYTKTEDNRWENRNFTIFINDPIRFSSLKPAGELIFTPPQLAQLRDTLLKIHDHFRPLYNGNDDINGERNPHPFAMDVEFKLDLGRDGKPALFIKQARPY